MHKVDGSRLVYSPSDLIHFAASPFASWMDRLHLEIPDRAAPDPASEEEQILWKKGLEHERALLEQLKASGRDVCEIPDKGDRHKATEAAMRAGREIIYQAKLESPPFGGFADFLERVPGKSKLGDFHYTVSDTKLARDPRPKFLIQLCAYADMLEEFQGVRPARVSVILREKTPAFFRTDDYYYCYLAFKKSFLEFMAAFNPDQRPPLDLGKDHGRWASTAERILRDADHLSLVAGMTRTQARKLEATDISTLKGLAASRLARVPKMLDPIFVRLREQATLQFASAGKAVPEYKVIFPSPEDPRKGLAILPPATPLDVYFDMEGYPHFEGGLEYLFGATYVEAGKPEFIDWWAHTPAQEKKAFQGFIDWAHARWRRDPAMHIYHYASYEVSAMRRLMGSHGTREAEVDDLLRNEVFVDLYAIVKSGLRVGTESYSIKDVERLYRGKRSGEVKEAGGSIVAYQRWLESGQPPDPAASAHLKSIRDYNRDDCDSTWQLALWLRERQVEARIAWFPKPLATPEEEKADTAEGAVADIPPARVLAETLLGAIPADPEARAREAERFRIEELIAHLLEFHRREAKPVWWAMFARHAMTESELVDDIACLGGLERETGGPVPIKRSKGFWYTFDLNQDTKLARGGKCMFAHDLALRCEIEEMDREKGRILLKLGPKALGLLPKETPPARLSLIPDEHVSAKVIADSILATVTAYRDTGKLPKAIEDFLYRRAPRIRGHKGGPLSHPGEDPSDAALRIVPALDESTLTIQGPPGSGKTYTAAKVILALVRAGKRVGVTATSHKAIMNVFTACADQAKGKLACIKIKGNPADPFFQACQGARAVASLSQVAPTDLLVGGTAWDFSGVASRDGFDYLFVDEAGQVSVANLLGMAPSAKNLVLIGDQMQLGQPIQGTHPGQSGLSVLDYYLEGKATIRPEQGLFLETTRRLHPGICDFISGAIYEGRLRSEAMTAKRVIRLGKKPPRYVPVEAGLLFVPVEHEGNAQGSDEEVAAIQELVAELLAREKTDEAGKVLGPVSLKDILFVAPYNMQVRKLQAALGPGAKVGSVDRFQGQEAAIVVVSMCSSDAESSSRGIEFLMNRQRLNVAVSRAESLAIVVASPALVRTQSSSVEQMELLNTFCRMVGDGSRRQVPPR
jgi:predicted RecB family nuclease